MPLSLNAMDFRPLGDAALIADGFEDPRAAASFAAALQRSQLHCVIEVFSAFNTVAIRYEPARFGSASDIQDRLRAWIAEAAKRVETEADISDARRVNIPVRYGGAEGPDLREVADRLRMSVDEVIELHSAAEYRVLAIGFMPGFGYLDGLPGVLKLPRKAVPRTRVKAGSVGIGGPYTGVYPFNSPGGWHLIAHTDLALFDPQTPSGALLRVGDVVRFVPIREGTR